MHVTSAYLHHLFKAKEMVSSTLATIHNERFIVRLVDQIRASMIDGTFRELREDVLSRYYSPDAAREMIARSDSLADPAAA